MKLTYLLLTLLVFFEAFSTRKYGGRKNKWMKNKWNQKGLRRVNRKYGGNYNGQRYYVRNKIPMLRYYRMKPPKVPKIPKALRCSLKAQERLERLVQEIILKDVKPAPNPLPSCPAGSSLFEVDRFAFAVNLTRTLLLEARDYLKDKCNGGATTTTAPTTTQDMGGSGGREIILPEGSTLVKRLCSEKTGSGPASDVVSMCKECLYTAILPEKKFFPSRIRVVTCGDINEPTSDDKQCFLTEGLCLETEQSVTVFESTEGRNMSDFDQWKSRTLRIPQGCSCHLKRSARLVDLLE
ncbi:uncharacterized protein LOC130646274 [Hydractinia symbiolongicarpus]|uniref:uncharacterized protein LOC130646274 n=1 Tax=Hydractinia symbiolongicarpus TaxID=13093 RepID=UPI00254DF416|nr:uncharacterized protein LOC130646274 [Hydractinia symbiolongicarpus]